MIREYIIKISDEIIEEEIPGTPQELIRCKNCKHGEPCNEDVFCTKDIGTIESSVHKPEWFCANGESR